MNGKQIRNIRAGVKMTRQEFADLLGISRRTLEDWEIDRHAPHAAGVTLLNQVKDGKLTKQK